MKRRLTSALVMLLAFALLIGTTAITASAETTYTAATGGTTTFSKYLIVDSDAHIPNVTFDFSIVPITTGKSATASTVAVYAPAAAGVTGTPTISDPAFTSDTTTTPTYDNVQTADNGKLNLDTGKKYAAKPVTVDFSGVTFPEPGIYRYVVTEAAATGAYSHDTQNTGGTALTRYLDVYVTDSNDGNGTLTVSSYVLHKEDGTVNANATSGSGDVQTAGAAVADKSASYVNEYATKDLAFSKKVEGNQASRDKYFKYTVTINGLTEGDTYTVDLSNAVAFISANPNNATTAITSAVTQPATLTVAANATSITQDFYLQHGQSIKILGLPTTATYTVVEAEEDYTKTATNDLVAVAAQGTQGDPDYVAAKIYDDNYTGTMNTDKYVGYTNTRNGIIPTGVIMTIAPFAIGICVFGAIIIFIICRRKRRNY